MQEVAAQGRVCSVSLSLSLVYSLPLSNSLDLVLRYTATRWAVGVPIRRGWARADKIRMGAC
jgi:hypothetical protein